MRMLLLVLCLTAGFCAPAQTDSVRVWNKWCSRRDTSLLFDGANNVISVYCPTIKPAALKVKSLDKSLRIGTPEKVGDTLEIMAMPYPNKGKNMRLAVMNKNNKVIRTVYFSSDTIPKLAARVGSITGKEASRKEILSQTTMKAYFPRSLYCYPYSIKQYTFHIHTDSVTATVSVPSFLLPGEVMKQIRLAPAGTIVEFTDIKAGCPECVTHTLDNIKVKIK